MHKPGKKIFVSLSGGNLEGYHANQEQFNNYLKKFSFSPEQVHNIVIIETMFVEPEARGKGIGTKLIESALNQIPLECEVWLIADKLESNNFCLVSWYENFGFEIIKETPSFALMRKKISFDKIYNHVI